MCGLKSETIVLFNQTDAVHLRKNKAGYNSTLFMHDP